MDLREQGLARTILVVALLVKPGALADLGDSRPLLWLKCQQAHNQILEVR